MEIRKVGVLGCGLMGAGIAQVAASAGFETVVKEVSDDLINKGFARDREVVGEVCRKRNDHVGSATRNSRAFVRHYFIRGPCGLRHHHRSNYREPRREAQHLPTVGRDLQTGNDLCFEYVVVIDYGDDDCDFR